MAPDLRQSTGPASGTPTRDDDLASAPPVGGVEFGSWRRLTPISRVFGFDRGPCIDRRYIERFLTRHAADVRGRVLEVADCEYTRAFGGDRVTRSDVLHAVAGNRKATIVGDLTCVETLSHDAFDCVILTQTLQHVYDARSAVRTLHHALTPGGVVLATVPGISQISRYDMERWGDFWRFTTLSARRLFEETFDCEAVEVQAHGNVLVACAFLHGLCADELTPDELDQHDPDYPVLITIRARKTGVSS